MWFVLLFHSWRHNSTVEMYSKPQEPYPYGAMESLPFNESFISYNCIFFYCIWDYSDLRNYRFWQPKNNENAAKGFIKRWIIVVRPHGVMYALDRWKELKNKPLSSFDVFQNTVPRKDKSDQLHHWLPIANIRFLEKHLLSPSAVFTRHFYKTKLLFIEKQSMFFNLK